MGVMIVYRIFPFFFADDYVVNALVSCFLYEKKVNLEDFRKFSSVAKLIYYRSDDSFFAFLFSFLRITV